jgi:hypothetical protein
MHFYTTIIVIAFWAVASMAEFICSPKAAPNAVTANFGGCCQTIDEHNGGQNCENIDLEHSSFLSRSDQIILQAQEPR